MRILSSVCFAIVIVATLFADAQELRAQLRGNQVYEPGSFQQVASDVNLGLPGRMWFRSTFADRGLGYQGAYLTLGGKRHLFEDSWDGRWLAEARFHYGLEEGGFFANGGIERVFSLDAAGADLVGGLWYTFDGDKQGAFAHDFSQVGVNAAIRTKTWDLIGNGYFPVGVTDYDTRGPSGNNVFFGSNILLQPGIDSALRGFDVTFRMRPKFMGFGNGIIDFGGYGYSSELINFFGGGRIRLGVQTKRGMTIAAEVNHDDRFNTTGALSLSWAFGGRGSAGGSLGLGNDLAETVRNDHIVRFNSAFEVAVDPATGLPYNVLHVNNTGDPLFGDGTYETPFTSLAAAELASVEGDIIFVNRGDGSRQGLNTGIVLKNRQQLLGVGGTNLIPLADGTLFQIPGEGARPLISNPGGTNVVTLANANTVRGVNIDGTGAVNGIYGNGVTEGLIEDTNVTGASEHGVELDGIAGNWTFRRNSFSDNIVDGLYVHNTTDNNSIFTFEENAADGNGFDGIHFDNYRAQQIRMLSNSTDNNSRHGIFLSDFVGAGLDLDIINHDAINNGGTGIFIDGGDGDLNIVNADATGNAINGVHVLNWSNSIAGDSTFIGISEGGTTNLSDNQQTNVVIELTDPGKTQDVLITDISIIGGGRAIFGSAAGIGTVLNMSVVNNGQFSQHLVDGLRFEAKNSGTLNVLIENDDIPLVLNDNGLSSGSGIAFFADGPLGQPVSKLNAVVRNVSINNDEESGFTSTVISPFGPDGISVNGSGTSRVNLLVEDSRIESAGAIQVDLDNSGTGEVNNLFFRNNILRADIPVVLNTNGGTLTDFAILDSDIQSNGLVRPTATGGSVDDPQEGGDPFLDGQGDFGFFLTVTGDIGGGLDNLTRIQIANNLIRDFTFDAVLLQTFGDAQVLAYINSNEMLRNGPGIDNLVEFPVDDPATFAFGDAPVDETQLNFFDAVEISAFDSSQVSLRMNGNDLVNNYELGLDLATFNTATINASINFNNFGNDIGQDADATTNNISTSFDFELLAVNSDFGTMCLDLSSNSFRAAADFIQFSPNVYRLELDGATNGFTDADVFDPGVSLGSVGICEGLISDEELFFTAQGFVDADTPPGGGFAPLDHD
jgi:hypothetical protein